jgi:DNA ligase (NAD+)
VEEPTAASSDDYIFDPTVKITCPYCGEPIEIITSDSGVENFMCVNDNCNSKLTNRLDHFCGSKGLDIKGLSKKTIGKLIDWGFVNGLTDIFRLERYKTEWESKTGFGKTSVGKILDAIDEAGRHTTLEAFISAIGIPLVGTRVSKEIVKYYPTWDEFRNAVGGKWSDLEGFGPEMESAINNFDYAEADEVVQYLTFPIEDEDENKAIPVAAIQGKTFVITGKLSRKRDDIKAEIEALGGKVTGSVSSKTDYLICNDKNSTTGKSADAKKLGIPVITEEEYLNLKS